MDTRLTATHDTRRRLLAIIVALAVVMALGVTSASAASPTVCRVQNTDTGTAYTALQAAVDAARKGGRLAVRGTCIGNTVIDKTLVIEGVRTPTSGKPTLSGAGKSRVVTITKGVRVRMRSLEIVRGSSSKGPGGGGILNQGTLTLIDVAVRGNRVSGRESRGGGIYNTGTLTEHGASSVSRNVGRLCGGVVNTGTLTLDDASRVSGNTGAFSGGGVCVDRHGTLTMNGSSSVTGNRGALAAGSSTKVPSS